MDSKEGGGEESRRRTRRPTRQSLLISQQKLEQLISRFQASGSVSSSGLRGLQALSQKVQQLLKIKAHIRDELDKVFAVEEVEHSCDICEIDLATDPGSPGVSVRKLPDVCVMAACGHVFHLKCLIDVDLDLDSTDPSCFLCTYILGAT